MFMCPTWYLVMADRFSKENQLWPVALVMDIHPSLHHFILIHHMSFHGIIIWQYHKDMSRDFMFVLYIVRLCTIRVNDFQWLLVVNFIIRVTYLMFVSHECTYFIYFDNLFCFVHLLKKLKVTFIKFRPNVNACIFVIWFH